MQPGSVMDGSPSLPDIAAEEDRVRQRRQSTLGGRRSCCSVGGRLSLANPPAPRLLDQVLRVEEGWPWAAKLKLLLDIALREAVRRLEARLPGDECVPELRAAVLRHAQTMARQLSERVCSLVPAAAAAAAANVHVTPITSASSEMYKEKTKALEQEYSKWRAMRKQREAECHAAEMEFQEAKSGVTTMDEGQELQLSPAQRSVLDSWQDCSVFVQEALQTREKASLVFEKVKRTTEVVNGFLTVSRLQADSSYTALESLSNAHIKAQPLSQLMNSLLQLHLTHPPALEEAQPSVGH